MNRIRILIADDQAIVCEGLNTILKAEDDFEIVDICHDGQKAIDLCRRLMPDIVLMDARMPLLDGIEATRIILDQNPHTKVIILTTFNEDTLILKGIKAGAKGFLLKDMQPDDLCGCIRQVNAGASCLHPDVIARLMDKIAAEDNRLLANEFVNAQFDLLTRREKEVLLLIGKGLSNAEIAASLYVAEGTVKNHVSSLLGKFEVRDRTQLAILAQKYMT